MIYSKLCELLEGDLGRSIQPVTHGYTGDMIEACDMGIELLQFYKHIHARTGCTIQIVFPDNSHATDPDA